MILIIALFSLSFCFAASAQDLSDRIIIDGVSTDFEDDEKILSDADGNLLESPADSYWGEYNDIKQIKVTWDASYLYLAVDGCSWDNNVLLFIDIYDDYGIEDMSELTGWQRAFQFYNWNPDFFIGTWDGNNKPQVWRVLEGGSRQIKGFNLETSEIITNATFDTGNLEGAMETKISFDSLYYSDDRSMENYPSIKLLALVTGGSDFTSSPDCAPDNLGGMTNDPGQMVVLDNYAEILINIDGIDGDNEPDMYVKPQQRTTFYKKPPFEAVPLLIQNVVFSNGKTFAPLLNENIFFTLETNRNSQFTVEIFDLNGKFINYAENTESLSWQWNGKNENGSYIPFGIYILRFIADSGEVSHKEAVVVIN